MSKFSHQQPPLPCKPQKQQRKLNKRNSQSNLNLNDFEGNLVDRTSQNNNLTTFVIKND